MSGELLPDGQEIAGSARYIGAFGVKEKSGTVSDAMKRLTGKVVIISGASGGIGRATTLALAKHFPRLVLASRSQETLERLAEEVRAMGCPVMICPTDVTDPAQVSQLIHQTLNEWDQIDFLIASNGQYIHGSFQETSIVDVERSLQVNFFGCFYLARAVLPAMLLQNSGHLIFISSMIAKKALPFDMPYVVAKYALSGFADALRQELYHTGVAVTTIFPARISTSFIDGLDISWFARPAPPETVAKSVIRAVHSRKAEIILPLRANLLYYLNVASPKMADWVGRVFHLESRWKIH